MIVIGQQLETREVARRLNVPVVGTYVASGPALLLMGAVFFGVGCFISLLGLEWIPIDRSRVHVPIKLLILVGLVFALPGSMLLFSGIKRFRAERRSRGLLALHPDQAWAWDGDWDGLVLEDRTGGNLLTKIFGIIFLGSFATVFHWIGFHDERAGSLFTVGSILVDIGLAIAIFFFVQSLLRLARHGRGKLRLAHMPIRPGQPCRLQLSLESDLSLFDALHLDLAYVEERVVETGSGRNRSRQVIAEARIQEHQDIQLEGALGGMQNSLDILLHLPETSPKTRLSIQPARSWQLGIHLEALGLDYKGRFVLPVYQTRSSPPPPSPITEAEGALIQVP